MWNDPTKNRTLLKEQVIPLKNAVLSVIRKRLDVERLPVQWQPCHRVVKAMIERAVADAQVDIGKMYVDDVSGSYNELISFLAGENRMLDYYLDMTAWEDLEEIKRILRKYALKIKEYREKYIALSGLLWWRERAGKRKKKRLKILHVGRQLFLFNEAGWYKAALKRYKKNLLQKQGLSYLFT